MWHDVGSPGYEQLRAYAVLRGFTLRATTIASLLTKPIVPRWRTVEAFVDACHEHARHLDLPLPDSLFDQGRWRADHAHVSTVVASRSQYQERSGPRNEVSGMATTVLQAGSIAGGVHIHPTSPSAAPVSAKPIMEWDPFDLDVHHAIRLDDSTTTVGETALPKYLRRDHDEELTTHFGDLNRSVMIVLTGGSSTGKTRALYEAVRGHEVLRSWPLAYPRSADDLLRLENIAPKTVLWLNETHNHLSGATGEVAAAWLRALLESSPGPVVVLGTLWPRYWSALIATPLGERQDDHPHARGLLQHRVHRVRVAEQFSAKELSALRGDRSIDPRLKTAATASGTGGLVIQTLAGGPALVERHEHPDHLEDRYAAAIVSAAIDARRLGHRQPYLSPALLEAGAYGYLDDRDRVDPAEDWFALGMARAAKHPLYGITALTAARREPGAGPADGYVLHDYLEQHGSTTRHARPVPDSLWEALVTHVDDTEDRLLLMQAAYRRLRYRYADRLFHRLTASVEPLQRALMLPTLVEYGRLELALTWIEQAGTLRHPFVHPHSTIPALRKLGRTADALTLLEQAVENKNNSLWAGRMLVDLLVELDRVNDALAVLRRLSTLDEDGDPERFSLEHDEHPWDRMLAHLLADHSRTEELQELAESGNQHAREKLADLCAENGEWEQALQLVRHGASWWTWRWLARNLAKAGRIDHLRTLAESHGTPTTELLIETLLAHGHLGEALERIGRQTGDLAHLHNDRLLALLIEHGCEDVAITLVSRQTIAHTLDLSPRPDRTTTWQELRGFSQLLVDAGHADKAETMLKQLVLDNTPNGAELLADCLADRGKWADALELVRSGAPWTLAWLPKRLSRAGNIGKLRQLADSGNSHAREACTDLLMERGRVAEAIEMLRVYAANRDDRAAEKLVEILAARGEESELRARAAGGDRYAAQWLVALAQQGKLGDAENLLRFGLTFDGAVATVAR
ncbi:tetratricopeptide repeat protein [Amycolatopsis alba]|uniref:tetratricopeptide repeat protein n=1 Tax=Amycolatopsis alba TaxID=76020 RepID=UPI001178A51A|nr:tetratricopeptide repeat protein [Amycolatopsis alba]